MSIKVSKDELIPILSQLILGGKKRVSQIFQYGKELHLMSS